MQPSTGTANIARIAGRISWRAVGAAVAIGLALSVAGPPRSPFLLASLGGSTTFLFGLTRAPAAQPRALVGGHVGSAAIGIVCYKMLGDAVWVSVLAVVVTLVVMLITRTVHPPAGANPLIMVHEHADVTALWQPIGLGVVTLAVIAALWSRVGPHGPHYPVSWFEPSPPSIDWGWLL
jgi:CBS-domain-containing membrane protein